MAEAPKPPAPQPAAAKPATPVAPNPPAKQAESASAKFERVMRSNLPKEVADELVALYGRVK